MNIFQVLSQGKSRLHEPSMSAMLGYLLASDEDHGLGDAFIKVFLSKLSNDLCKKAAMRSFINSQVSLEEPYQLNGARKDIDIQISLLEENHTEAIRIIVENKIKVGAANPKQLADYYQAVLQDDPNLKNLVVVFVTPETPNSQLKVEFENLNGLPENHFKEWIFWDSNTEHGIVSMLREILCMESVGKINPINEYMRHTLKAFIKHASSVVQPMSNIRNRMGGDIGEIIDEASISLNDGSQYRVVRRDSAQIQVFNSETGEKEIAFNILARFIDEKGLQIPHSQLNTRTIGRRFFEWHSKSN
jgi:hypothetical protein